MPRRVPLALPALVAAQAPAQQPPPSTQPADERLDRLERRLNELEAHHRQELQARDEEIARLKAQLGAQPATAPATAPQDEIERTKQEILQDLEQRQSPVTAPAAPAAAGPRPAASFNPDLAVVADFIGNYSPDRDNDAYNRLDVREVELDLRAAVHPKACGATAPRTRRRRRAARAPRRRPARAAEARTAPGTRFAHGSTASADRNSIAMTMTVPSVLVPRTQTSARRHRKPASQRRGCRPASSAAGGTCASAIALAMLGAGFVLSVEMQWPLSQSVGGAGFAALLASHVTSHILRR